MRYPGEGRRDCAIIGVLIGCYSAYRGGWFDSLMVRVSEVFMSVPQLILVLMLVAILGQSAKNRIKIVHKRRLFDLFKAMKSVKMYLLWLFMPI